MVTEEKGKTHWACEIAQLLQPLNLQGGTATADSEGNVQIDTKMSYVWSWLRSMTEICNKPHITPRSTGVGVGMALTIPLN